ncbi:hypothetical protein [Streptomyces chrestomyceticus]|uniref:hypothetical protein n=1 Tax=Streptomyces chrestomyceticus TaxID=68185 RepID=UPI0019D193D2|nr:hypothetical protein [Streptomyces chrestomyceticus]
MPAGWRHTVRAVHREQFIPDVIETNAGIICRHSSPQAWLAAVYDDVPITTQVNDGGRGALHQ